MHNHLRVDFYFTSIFIGTKLNIEGETQNAEIGNTTNIEEKGQTGDHNIISKNGDRSNYNTYKYITKSRQTNHLHRNISL